MRTAIRSFSDGWRWGREALALWRTAPLLTGYLSFGYLLGLMLLSAIPLVGQVAAAAAMPILQVGVLEGMRAAERRLKAGPEVLFAGFRRPWQPLVAVGIVNLAGNLLVLFLATAIAGPLTPFKPAIQAAPELDGALTMGVVPDLWPLALFFLLSLPVTAAYWFAPPLIAWHQIPWPKALFFSFYATLRNWAALLGWFLFMGLVIGSGALIAALAGTLLHPFLLTLGMVLIPMVIIPILFASYYRQVTDLFVP